MPDFFDTTEVRKLAKDFGKLPVEVHPPVRAVLQKGALNIKNSWRARWSGHPHIPALPYAVTYDTRFSREGVEAEIGPDKDKRQGPLGNIIEFGTPRNSPIPGGLPALKEEAPKFEKALTDVIGKLVEEA